MPFSILLDSLSMTQNDLLLSFVHKNSPYFVRSTCKLFSFVAIYALHVVILLFASVNSLLCLLFIEFAATTYIICFLHDQRFISANFICHEEKTILYYLSSGKTVHCYHVHILFKRASCITFSVIFKLYSTPRGNGSAEQILLKTRVQNIEYQRDYKSGYTITK